MERTGLNANCVIQKSITTSARTGSKLKWLTFSRKVQNKKKPRLREKKTWQRRSKKRLEGMAKALDTTPDMLEKISNNSKVSDSKLIKKALKETSSM